MPQQINVQQYSVSQINAAYRESNIYQDPVQVLSRENDLYGSSPPEKNQYADPDHLHIPSVGLPQSASNISHSYMDPESAGVIPSDRTQNDYVNLNLSPKK